MLAALLLQTSLLVAPVHLGEQPPEGRAVRGIQVTYAGLPGVSATVRRDADQARALADQARERLAGGADFAQVARKLSANRSARHGGVLGTYWPGMLPAELDAFLFAAEVGELSGVLASPTGFWVLQRVERDAGCRQILVAGSGAQAREEAEELLRRLRAGADFAELARERSDDAFSAPRGGELGIFTRGPEDSVLRAACFGARVGELVGPIESPLGWHVLQRVPPESIDPELADDVAARGRAILIAFAGALGADPRIERSQPEARQLAEELAARLRAGADMAALAREHSDDLGSRERGGDLGWIRRRTTSAPHFVDRLFLEPRGELIGPIASNAGFVLLRREDRAGG